MPTVVNWNPSNPRHWRSPRNLQLNDIYPEWYNNGGVFSSLSTYTTPPFPVDTGLDIAYHGQRSGEKFIQGYLYKFINTDGILSSSGLEKVATMISSRYYKKWESIYDLFNSDYDKFDTYRISEVHNGTITKSGTDDATRTPNLSYGDTQSSSLNGRTVRTPDLTIQDTGSSETTGSVNETPNLTRSNTRTLNTTSSQTRTPNITEVRDEDTTVSTNGSGTDALTHGHIEETSKTSSTTTSSGSTTENETTESIQAQTGVYGFDSQSDVPSNTETTLKTSNSETSNSTTGTESLTGTNTVEHSGTDTTLKSDSRSTETDSQVTTRTTGSETTSGTEGGTIGDSESTTGSYRTATSDETDSSNVRTETGTDTSVRTDTSTFTGTKTETGTERNTKTSSGLDTNRYTTTRTGNIYYAPAEILLKELEFYKNDFFELVFSDLDNLLTLAIYGEVDPRVKVF